MTRSEFEDNVNTWWELIDFCREIDCDVCDDIYDEDYAYDRINDSAQDWIREDGWEYAADKLSEIPRECEYYYYNYDNGNYEEADDYLFDDFKDRVLNYCDRYDEWDEVEEEDSVEEEEPIKAEEDNEEEIKEEFCIDELFSSCSAVNTEFSSEIINSREDNDEGGDICSLLEAI